MNKIQLRKLSEDEIKRITATTVIKGKSHYNLRSKVDQKGNTMLENTRGVFIKEKQTQPKVQLDKKNQYLNFK